MNLSGMVETAKSLIRPVRRAAYGSALAAFLLSAFVWFYIGFDSLLSGGLSTLLIAIFFAPPGVILLFTSGLEQIVGLPSTVMDTVRSGNEMRQAGFEAGIRRQPRRSVTGILRAVYRLGRMAMDARGAILDSAALIRLMNPITLGIVLCAVAASTLWWILVLVIGVVLLLG